MNLRTLLITVALPISVLFGCAHQADNRGGTVNMKNLEHGASSSGPAQPVYGTVTANAPGGGFVTLTRTNVDAAQTSAFSTSQATLNERVRNLLLSDKTLVPYPGQVIATVHPYEEGTIILNGAVPNAQVKKRLIDQVASIPGVTRVDDRLKLELPDDPSTGNIRDIEPRE
jgi:hypothetical protein